MYEVTGLACVVVLKSPTFITGNAKFSEKCSEITESR